MRNTISSDEIPTGDCSGDQHALVLVAAVTEAAGVKSLRFERSDGQELRPWEPGAHLEVILASGLVRQYSLCGDPADRTGYVVAVLDQTTGRGGSREMHSLAEGEQVHCRGPKNHFELVEADSYLFIAGGIGITPILPMVRRVRKRQLPWEIAYGGRSRVSMAFVDDLSDLARADQIQIVPEDESGLIDLAALLDGRGSGVAVYCCGPEPLLRAVEAICQELGLAAQLHLERFAASGGDAGPATPGRRPIAVNLAASGIDIVVGADESILDRVLEVVPGWPWGCHEGYCGTCEATVISGVPEHHDDVLSDQERVAGDTMMICVGRATSQHLALDI